jgi:cellulose biosynthesis protein BcsQ
MNIPMYYVGASKGGVGKSLFSFALADYLLNQKRNVLLLENGHRQS